MGCRNVEGLCTGKSHDCIWPLGRGLWPWYGPGLGRRCCTEGGLAILGLEGGGSTISPRGPVEVEGQLGLGLGTEWMIGSGGGHHSCFQETPNKTAPGTDKPAM